VLKFNTKNVCSRNLSDALIIRKYRASVKRISDDISIGKLPGTEMMG
jgi:hypothetical protein